MAWLVAAVSDNFMYPLREKTTYHGNNFIEKFEEILCGVLEAQKEKDETAAEPVCICKGVCLQVCKRWYIGSVK